MVEVQAGIVESLIYEEPPNLIYIVKCIRIYSLKLLLFSSIIIQTFFCLFRRERQLNDVAYKMKRASAGGPFPSHLGTPPRDCPSSDSSDNEVDAGSCPHRAAVMAAAEKSADSGNPLSGWSKKKMWRKKRRYSTSKDEKTSATGFLEKVTNSDRLTRKQTLPPLNTLAAALSHDLDCDPSTPTLDDATLDAVSRDSTPRPKHSSSPITPNGSFSLEVSELLESVRHPLRFGRNVSGGSVRSHRRQGSNGSVASERGCSLETTPLRGLSTPTTATSSKRASTDLGSPRRGSNAGVPYTRMDSYSDSNSEVAEKSPVFTTGFPKPVPERPCRNENRKPSPGHAPDVSKELYSNESSMDTQHESDGAGHDADGESTSDGCENRFYRFSTSGTEPNETQESNIESSAASPSLAESDELVSSSAADVEEPIAALTADLLPHTHSEVSGYGSQTGFAGVLRIPSLPLPSLLRSEEWSRDPTTATPTETDSASRHGTTSLSNPTMIDAKYGQLYGLDETDTSPETSLTGLTMPLHLRSLDNQDDGMLMQIPVTP